jgi:hypothetical protein
MTEMNDLLRNALVAFGLVFALMLIGFITGYNMADRKRVELEARLEADIALQEQQADIALAHWEQEREDREHYQEALQARLAEVAQRPDYQRMCLDDDGMRIANDALKGAR